MLDTQGVREQQGFMSLPLMVRANSVIPVESVEDRPDYEYADGVTFHVFALEDGATASARVPALDGSPSTEISVARVCDAIGIKVDGATKPWSVVLRGVEGVALVEGGTAETETNGVRLNPAAPDGALAARL
ncbi:MAG: hypothetical protein J7M39_12360 [Anaerolineae bacterium]|nr:hypothetical protein [Anaerolineae bacterium]